MESRVGRFFMSSVVLIFCSYPIYMTNIGKIINRLIFNYSGYFAKMAVLAEFH